MSRSGIDVPVREDVRELIHARLQESQNESGEKLSIAWRGDRIHRHVISMPVDLLFYNPDTRRIRAQRTVDPVRDEELQKNPWGAEAQLFLEMLLKNQPSDPKKVDPDFLKLRDDLADFGQQHPGLITPDGVLVNGNTRCAALRDLGRKHIRVAVLPDDTTSEDISDVELALQLRKEHKRDYSYINRLIAIDEQLRRSRPPAEVARDFRIQRATLDRDMWIFNLINEAIDRSKTEEGTSLRLVDFEDHQEKLRELHRAYVKESGSNQEAADQLRESRLTLILLGFSKTDIRNARPEFHSAYFESRLPDNVMEPTVAEATSIAIPGLDLEIEGPSMTFQKTHLLTDTVLQAKTVINSSDTVDPKQLQDAVILYNEIYKAADSALDLAGRDERLRKRKLAAADRISDATEAIEQASSDVANSMAKNALDEDFLDETLIDLHDALIKLGQNVARAVHDPGEGILWLTSLGVETDD